ncbi:MAG: phosphoribosyl-AMP cyclohydrolase [Gammaproteobacteria bacterium]|nr:phosphoribosyl-AMP cyclohydrolase [Gammaproteobacteria bacterium]
MSLIDAIKFNADDLVPAIAQDAASGQVLMMAWMNAEAVQATLDEGIAVYYSRSRQTLWRKGESSGHTQRVHSVRLDCDGDTLLLQVEQVGGIACHTGRANCFYRAPQAGQWVAVDPVLKSSEQIYGQ